MRLDRLSPSAGEIDWMTPWPAHQKTLDRDPPHLVRVEFVDPFPIKTAILMVQPYDASDMRQKHLREKAHSERVADHHDCRAGIAGRLHIVKRSRRQQFAGPGRQRQTLAVLCGAVVDAENPADVAAFERRGRPDRGGGIKPPVWVTGGLRGGLTSGPR